MLPKRAGCTGHIDGVVTANWLNGRLKLTPAQRKIQVTARASSVRHAVQILGEVCTALKYDFGKELLHQARAVTDLGRRPILRPGKSSMDTRTPHSSKASNVSLKCLL